MPGDAVVSPLPHGAARVIDYVLGLDPANPGNFRPRIGATATAAVDATSSSVAGVAQAYVQVADGSWWVRQRAFYSFGNWRFPIFTNRPAVRRRAPTIGLTVWEFNLAFFDGVPIDAAPAIVLAQSGDGFLRPDDGTSRGVELRSVGGRLTYVARRVAAGAAETVDLGAYHNPLNQSNHVAFEIRNATIDTDASLSIVLNGVTALKRSWPSSGGQSGFLPYFSFVQPLIDHKDAATYMYYQGMRLYAGPDVVGL